MKALMKRGSLVMAVCLLAVPAVPSLAARIGLRMDLERCIDGDGRPMPQKDCDLYRRILADDEARRQAKEEQSRKLQAEWEEQRQRAQAEAEMAEVERRERAAAAEARYVTEQAERKAAAEVERRQRAAAEAREAAWIAKRQKECGADFGRPVVGMTLARAKHCVGDFELYSQINRAGGVVSMYRSPTLHISVMNERIVHWSRY